MHATTSPEEAHAVSHEVVVGLDEAGAGPAFGSLWAAATHLPPMGGDDDDCERAAHALTGLTDSKKMTPKRRATLRATLLTTARYGLGEVTQSEIDEWGLGEARRVVFERALDDYVAKEGNPFPTRLIVDGTLFRSWRGVPHECVPQADATVPCVSAASVLAKTTRDAQVLALVDEDPSLDERYGIRSNKGYLSATHIAGIRKHGYASLHRRSYRIRGLS